MENIYSKLFLCLDHPLSHISFLTETTHGTEGDFLHSLPPDFFPTKKTLYNLASKVSLCFFLYWVINVPEMRVGATVIEISICELEDRSARWNLSNTISFPVTFNTTNEKIVGRIIFHK